MFCRKYAVFVWVLSCLSAHWLRAGVPLEYYLPEGTKYDPRVPTPQQYLGWQIGDWHLRSEQVNGYLQAVAAAAPHRVKFEIMGYSHEQKPLVLLTLSSPDNLRRLDQIRTEHLALLDPAQSARLDVERMPVVIDLGYSIHGNEPSGVNAMVLFVYHLAAAQGPGIDEQLRQAVVLIEAQRNPDGGDRAAQWFNQHKSLGAPSVDPMDREHNEAWPGGRYNHYWFDPNRDWLPLVHPEARARAELFHRWRPHVLTDHHEMMSGKTFFFQPGVPTRNNPSTPGRIRELTAEFATFHQKILNRHGVLYFSEQGYDDFYPGKGSTYPDLHGTVGILFEQATTRGHAVENDNGVLTFAYAIRNQVLTSFSSLEAAIALRPALLAGQRDFARDTAALAEKSPVQAYVFGDAGDPVRVRAFVELLFRHQIQVRPLGQPVTQDGKVFQPGAAWVVPVRQPQFRLLSEIFTLRTEFEENVFYDISAWNLALAYDLPFVAVATVPPAAEVLTVVSPVPPGALVGGHSDYAYLFAWSSANAPRALWRLQQAGIQVKGLTGKAIEAVGSDGTRLNFKPGAVLVPVGIQPNKAALIRGIIDRIVQEDAITVLGCATGLTPVGVDFGSNSFQVLAAPRVALVTGKGVDAQEIGAAWHALDQRVGLSPTLLDVAQLSGTDLDRYQCIYFASGTYDTSVSDATIAELKRWVGKGGTLLLTGRAVTWAAKKELAALEIVPTEEKPDLPTKEQEIPPAVPLRKPYESAADQEALELVAGAIFAVSIDPSHPLGYGFMDEQLALCRTNTIFLKAAKSPYETPAVYTASPLLCGYASPANQKRVANSAAVVALAMGKGAVVALPDSPVFRGYWLGGDRLLFNAVFYGRTITVIKTGVEASTAANDH